MDVIPPTGNNHATGKQRQSHQDDQNLPAISIRSPNGLQQEFPPPTVRFSSMYLLSIAPVRSGCAGESCGKQVTWRAKRSPLAEPGCPTPLLCAGGTILPGSRPLHRSPDHEKHGQRSRTAANGQSKSHKKGQRIHYALATIGHISAIALCARTNVLPDATSVREPREHLVGADKPSAQAAIPSGSARTNFRRSRPCRRLAGGGEPSPPTPEGAAQEP